MPWRARARPAAPSAPALPPRSSAASSARSLLARGNPDPAADRALSRLARAAVVLRIFGLSMVATLSGRRRSKGLTAAGLGLMMAMIGCDAQTGTLRWTFGSLYLWDRLPLVPATLGIFAMPELADMAVVAHAASPASTRPTSISSSQWEGVRDAVQALVADPALLDARRGLGRGARARRGGDRLDRLWPRRRAPRRTPRLSAHGDIRGVIARDRLQQRQGRRPSGADDRVRRAGRRVDGDPALAPS